MESAEILFIDLDIEYQLVGPFLRALKPEPRLTVNEWADQYRVLPSSNSEPGRFRSSRTPYMEFISFLLSSKSKAQVIILMKAAQVAATELGNNWAGHTIHVDPANFLYIMPTDSMAKSVSKTRIKKMIELCPELSKRVKSNRERDSGNTILEKEFEGGMLKFVGANAPAGLSSFNAKKVYADEVDRYPQDVANEGDVISLAFARTTTFGDSRKILITSTPTVEETSIINREFQKTSQYHYHLPCPICGAYQKMIAEQLRWEPGKYHDVQYQCGHCAQLFPEHHKTEMLSKGQWISDYPDKEDGIRYGLHLGGLLSPLGWFSWTMWAREYDDCQNDPTKMKTFVNTRHGLCYSAGGEVPDWEALYNKRQDYKINQPNDKVIFITAGADIQKDRIEVEIVGWGKGKQSWSLDYRVLLGNTDSASNPVWDELDKVVNETWTRIDGATLPMRLMAVDSGNNTTVVYEFCARYPASKVIAVKGGPPTMATVVSTPRTVSNAKAGSKISGGMKVWMVGVSLIKTELYGWLQLQHLDGEEYQHGYCHFPMYDETHFRSLTSEKLQSTTNKKGFPVQAWVKHYTRNERLDCRVYARAAAFVLGIDRLTDNDWQRLYDEIKDTIPEHQNVTIQPVERKRKRSNTWDR
jgi:phage terminase large subunit GpA-like protein